MRSLALPRLAALLALGLGCGETVKPEYRVEIVGPVGTDPFAEATRVVLTVADRTSEIAIEPGEPFSISLEGLEPAAGTRAAVVLDAFAADGHLVAHGETPPVELVLLKLSGLRVIVQAPGSLAQVSSTLFPRRDHVVVEMTDKASGNSGVLFGTGTVVDDAGETRIDGSLGFWDPVSADYGGVAGVLPPARHHATALALSDGRALVFGGETLDAGGVPKLSGTAHVLRATGGGIDGFTVALDGQPITLDETLARSAAPLAIADGVFAFGGRSLEGALATVVRVEVAQATGTGLLPQTMNAARAGHTATSVAAGGINEVLIFGGAAPGTGAPVAERFRPMGTTFQPFDAAQTGPNRRDHGALALDGKTVLVVGGRGDGDQALDDGVLFDAATDTFTAKPGLLSTPRTGFCLFRVDGDIVAAGGIGADGQPLGSADVIDATSLERVATVPALARAGAACSALPNHAAILIGGTAADGAPTGAIEVYQPRR